jgi:hypothetical protein
MKSLYLSAIAGIFFYYGNTQGNVGIGLTTPLYRLDVTSTGLYTARFVNTGGGVTNSGIYATANTVANSGYGVHGIGGKFGVWGETASEANVTGGVRGSAGLPAVNIVGKYGVLGESNTGKGVVGVSTDNNGLYGYSSSGWAIRGEGPAGAVYAHAWNTNTAAILASHTATTGTSYGLYGVSNSTDGGAGIRGDGDYVGVWGESAGRWGVYGKSSGTSNSYGVYGTVVAGSGNYAGFFSGDLRTTGTLSKASGSFMIDHPLDPANKYLYHSFVESPDMMNIYNGNVMLDANGAALVTLPDWFEALNKDFRYQLTCVGGFAPVYIAQKISGNQFRIAGGTPGLEVSWLVTGIRKDAYAEKNRLPVEVLKPAEERGFYLHPEAFGLKPSLSIEKLKMMPQQQDIDK